MMETLYLEFKDELLEWQKKGLMYTRTGYGKKIPTQYKANYNNRWYRVYCTIYSNVGTCWIQSKGKQLVVDKK